MTHAVIVPPWRFFLPALVVFVLALAAACTSQAPSTEASKEPHAADASGRVDAILPDTGAPEPARRETDNQDLVVHEVHEPLPETQQERQPTEGQGGEACVPKTCAQLGKDCGFVPDGCGGQLTCGDCTLPQTCGGGGTSNVCGLARKADCTPITQRQDWELCQQSSTTCAGIFKDSAGCQAFCAAVGMVCKAVYEDAPNCSKDTSRPALSCANPSGHQSDYCECGFKEGNCQPACNGRTCGDDGCGGVCGRCAATETCQSGQCQPANQPKENCKQYPFQSQTLLAELLGFGAKTRGGDPKNVYRVKNLKDSGAGSLRAAVESTQSTWIVFDVQGTIKLSSRLDFRSNKTIDGRGRDVKIEGHLRLPPGTKHVIISDVSISNPAGDAIEVRGDPKDAANNLSTRNFWFHHLQLSNSGDGLIDVTHAATDITISWCHFHTHLKAILIASDDSYPKVDAGIRLTLHHNHFDKITRRGPRLRFGLIDYFNNYQNQWYEYGAGSFSGAQLLSENNIYEARPGTYCFPTACPDPNPGGDNDRVVSKKGLINDWASMGLGYIRSVGDTKKNGAELTSHEPQKVFQRATFYAATPDKADEALRQRILTQAGPRTTYCKQGTP